MNFLSEDNFIQSRQDGNCYLFKNIEQQLPFWTDIIENLNISIQNNWLVKYLNGFGFVTHNAELIPQVGDILKYINTLDTNVPSSAHCYFSLTDRASTFGRHRDPSDVFFWQCIGQTQWTVESKTGVVIYTLEPNDLLYVPRGMWHNTKPITPRAGISFGLDY
jgi:mannose-6-phosphate isomerase-like protein (cupin superfamily)